MAVLTKGDQFGMREGAVFCQHHYQQFLSSASSSASSLGHQQQSSLPSQLRTIMPPSMTPTLAVQSPYPSSRALESPAPAFFNGSATGTGNAAAVSAPAQPRQKGRPRKRKPKDLDAMTANMGK